MHKHFPIRRLIAILVVSILVFSGFAQAQDDVTSVTISATSEGLVVPESVPAGWVEITFENTGDVPLFTIIGRLDDDATMDQFMEALMGLMGGDYSNFPPATFIGSPTISPGGSQAALYNLEAGTYVLLNAAGEMPEIATFSVEGEAADADFAPESDLTVALVDFAFAIPANLPAGEQTWLIENVGEQWHEMVFMPVPDGTTLEDATAMMMEPEGEGAEEEDAGSGMPELAFAWSPMSEAEQAWVTVDLAPGTYLVTCFIPDVSSEEHLIHAELGMMQIVSVSDTTTFVDPNGLFTLDYAAELTSVTPDLAAQFGFPVPSVGIIDSETTLQSSVSAELLEPGAWGFGVLFIPDFMFAEMGMPEDATLADLAIAFSSPDPENNAEGYVLGDVIDVTLDDGTPAVQIEVSGETEDNLVIFFEITDGIYANVALLTAPDGRTDELIEQFWLTVNTIEFTGTIEDIMAGMSGE